MPLWRDPSSRRYAGPIVVGLVNNMPDAAVKSTERQFRELLADAAGGQPVRVRAFSLPGLARSDAGRQYVGETHEDIGELWGAELDGLIVTGTEPKAADFADEPYWPALTRLVDWAAEHTVSAVWSCLACHAAVHYLDGLVRKPLPAKLSGVFECGRVSDHPFVRRGPARWRTPHSRYNELADSELAAHGYRILSRSAAAGADIFIKRRNSLFLFLQGHPEYDAGALLREYRRDVGRYLAGEREAYPDLPCGYFDEETADSMREFREQAIRERDGALLPSFQMLLAQQSVQAPWRPAALRLFRNWLSFIAAEKAARHGWVGPRRAAAAAPEPAPAHG